MNRHMSRLLAVIAFCCPLDAGAGERSVEQREMTRFEAECLAARRAITSGHATITATTRLPNGRATQKDEYWVDFEGSKMRFDFHISQAPEGGGGLKCRNIITEDATWVHQDEKTTGFNTAVGKLLPEHAKRPPIFDPRLFGMSIAGPSTLHAMDNMEAYIGRMDGTTIKVESDVVDGVEAGYVECLQVKGHRTRPTAAATCPSFRQ